MEWALAAIVVLLSLIAIRLEKINQRLDALQDSLLNLAERAETDDD